MAEVLGEKAFGFKSRNGRVQFLLSLYVARHKPKACLILVIYKCCFSGQYFDTTEVYNIETNTWSVLSSRLPLAAKNIGLCYVFDVEKL